MSVAPGNLHSLHHYGGSKLSDVERKMISVMSSSFDDEEGDGDEEMTASTSQEGITTSTSSFSQLPIELIDRILDYAIFDDSFNSNNGSTSGSSSLFNSSQLISQASKICLVCRQFDQLSRSKMYRKVNNLSTREMRPFLNIIKMNEKLAAMVQNLTLDSKIWTDVDENVIADIFLAVRRYCKVLKVGANESPMLPYLFYGKPRVIEEEEEADECALQVLDLCWRDEVEVQHQRGDEIQGNDEMQVDTLRNLFQHTSNLNCINRLDNPTRRLHHLTIDLYSQSQLTQLFNGKGFFVQEILPNLTFLRIELPLVVLQFKCDNPGDLVQGWPRDDWDIDERHLNEAIQDRQLQTRRTSLQFSTEKISRAGSEIINDEEVLMMPYCPSNQLKTLTLRFLLNVHRNDMTLFKLLIPQEALDKPDHSWSVRASITAQCLSSTMQKHLNLYLATTASPPNLIAFPLAQYKKKTAEVYWKQKWASAHEDFLSSLPSSVQSYSSSADCNNQIRNHNNDMQIDSNRDRVKVSLLLKWPNAVDAFFHYSAMTTTIR